MPADPSVRLSSNGDGVQTTRQVSETHVMELRRVDDSGVTNHDLADLHGLRNREDGFVWLDIPLWSADVERVLAEEFRFHSLAIAASRERNHTPRIHIYPDQCSS